jgi:hypothetical protein
MSTLNYLAPSLEHNITELDKKKDGPGGHRKRGTTIVGTKDEVSILIC